MPYQTSVYSYSFIYFCRKNNMWKEINSIQRKKVSIILFPRKVSEKVFLRKEFCGFLYLCVFVFVCIFVCISASVYLSLICHFWKCAHICLTIQNICKTPVPYVSNLTKCFGGNVLIIVLVLSIVATLHCGLPSFDLWQTN